MKAILQGEGIIVQWDWGNTNHPYVPYNFLDYLIRIGMEALARFPEGAYSEIISWKLAYWESNLVMPMTHFVASLEQALNSGDFQLDELSSSLTQYGFKVIGQSTASNLFGDEQLVRIIQIEVSVSDSFYMPASGVVVISGAQTGDYHVKAVTEWINTWHGSLKFTVEDHNGNGIPEIAIEGDYWGSGFPGSCGSHLSLYEWRGNYPEGRFVNIAKNVTDVFMSSAVGACRDPWGFGERDPSGAQPLYAYDRRTSWFTDCPDFVQKDTYTWNGNWYTWSGATIEPYLNSTTNECAVLWANEAGGLNDQAVLLLASALDNWPVRIDETFGPASSDFFRTRLGIWYALRGEEEQAVSILESVSEHPNHPEFTVAQRAAQTYLEQYQIYGPYAACQAVNQFIFDELFPISTCCIFGYSQESLIEKWGYADQDIRYSTRRFCDSTATFQRMVQSLQPKNPSELAQWFNTIGVAQAFIEKNDFTRDGIDDWLATIQYEGNSDTWYQYILVATKDKLTPIFVASYYEPEVLAPSISWQSFRPSTDSALYTAIFVENALNVFYIAQIGEQSRIEKMSRFWEVDHYEISTNREESTLAIWHGAEEEIYAWDTYLQTYVYRSSIPMSQDEVIALAEQDVLKYSKPTQAIPMLQNLLAGDIKEPTHGSDENGPILEPPIIRPYALYLLALAYELTGDETNAVRTYWQLWHDFPDNPYALAASAKLVPR